MTSTATAWLYAIVALIIGVVIGYFIWGTSSLSMSNTATSTATNTIAASPSADKEAALYTAMRKLWSDHVWWTREYIESVAAGNTSATNAAATRLMKNQEDIGNAIASYYGAAAGNQLTTLLKSHISIAVDLVAAAKANDTAKFNDANTRWQKNADDIATFLASANPNWPLQNLKDMMAEHLVTTTDEASATLKKDYVTSIAAFDKVFDHINKMADVFSAGIIQQFPDKFK